MWKTFKKVINNINATRYIVKKAKSEDGVDGRVIPYVDKNSYITEQYKVLRTNLYSLSPDKPLKTILITSAQPLEGKTITSCNLAFVISLDAEKKCMLVDCDLRKPAVHKMFGISRKPGFSDVLLGETEIEHFMEKPALGNLYIVPAGTTINNTSEILSAARIRDVINKFKSRFDYIIFDTPPAINVTDASILGALCDGVLLVVKLGVTQKNAVEEAFNLLRDAQAKPKACVLINAEMPTYFYYYKYRYYYKYPYGVKEDKAR